ncbi:MAG: hypothetical protein JXB35_04665 [Anaerolineae bacterium]|nr:hypothetical protein [Anaerolineae bacterium]
MRKRLVVGLLLLLLLSGCSERIHTPEVLEAWGRAGRVGVASRLTVVGLAVTPVGDRIVLLYPTRIPDASQDRIHLMILDGSGAVVREASFPSSISDFRSLQLIQAPGGALHLLWSAGRSGQREVHYVALPDIDEIDTAALPSLQGEELTPEDASAEWYEGTLMSSGELFVLWGDRFGNVFGGPTGASPERILEGTLGADVAQDAEGNLHLVWSQQVSRARIELNHGLLDATSLAVRDARLLNTIALAGVASENVFDGPVLGLEPGELYVFWIQKVTDMLGTVEELHSVALYRDAQGQVTRVGEPAQVSIPPVYPPRVAPFSGEFAIRDVAPAMSRRAGSTNFRHAPTFMDAAYDDTILAFSALYGTRSRVEYQPSLAVLRDGELLGYQVLTWTEYPSLRPALAADVERHLYLAWMDATGEAYHYPVYLASTAPDLHAAWRKMTGSDYLAVVVDLLNRVTLGVFMAPLTIVWFLLPFPLLFIGNFLFGSLGGNHGRRISLVMVFAYWALKYLLTFDILTHLPGLTYLPDALALLLIFLVPVGVLGLSVFLAWLINLRLSRRDFSALRAYFSIAAVDWVLSYAIYAIGYFE